MKNKAIVSRSSLPYSSSLKQTGYDYIDSFQGVFFDQSQSVSSTEIGRMFFASVPKWGQKLLTLRNKIVQFFGLKTTGNISSKQTQLGHFKCEQGEKIGPVTVFGKTDNEVIWGIDDKHLDFRVSLFFEQQKNDANQKVLTITTLVNFNKWLGRFYFLLITPFHKLIVLSMLKKIITELDRRV